MQLFEILSERIVKDLLWFYQGLALSIGTLIMEQLTGVYAELAFLDVALNFGQALIAFAIFGLDPGLGRIGKSIKKMCRKWREGKI